MAYRGVKLGQLVGLLGMTPWLVARRVLGLPLLVA